MALYKLGNWEPRPADGDQFWVADSACVIGNVLLGRDSSVWFGAVVRGDNEPIEIGARTNIQDNAVLHTDPGAPLTIGPGCTVGHRATLHGCTIGEGSLIGIGASVLNRAVIGKNVLIGAHALVTEGKVIPDGSVVMGAPGAVTKTLSAEQREMFDLSAQVYVDNWKRYAQELSRIDG